MLPDERKKRWATVRFGLGLAQMSGALLSLSLLLQTGLNEVSMTAVVLTTSCTAVSLMLFGGRPRGHL